MFNAPILATNVPRVLTTNDFWFLPKVEVSFEYSNVRLLMSVP